MVSFWIPPNQLSGNQIALDSVVPAGAEMSLLYKLQFFAYILITFSTHVFLAWYIRRNNQNHAQRVDIIVVLIITNVFIVSNIVLVFLISRSTADVH